MGAGTERERIIEENLKLYRLEAEGYISLHPEIYNWFEQGQIRKDLAYISKRLISREALDIGCAMGNIALKLLSLGFRVTALDISTTMIEGMGKELKEEMAQNLNIVQSDVDTFLSRTSSTYDLVTISSVLHHLPDYQETLKRIIGIIKYRGFMYITHEPLKDVLSKKDNLLRKILWQSDHIGYLIKTRGKNKEIEGVDWRLSDYHLYQGFDHDRVKELLEEAGFKVSFKKYSSTMRLGISNWIDSRLLKSESQFKILAEKVTG
ncbi:MAG: methyltransferase domain-containing protein [Nitrospirota bacterium]